MRAFARRGIGVDSPVAARDAEFSRMIRWCANSLRARLILIVTVVTAVPIFAATLYLGHLISEVSRDNAQHALSTAANTLALSVEKWDQSMVFALENLKNQPDIVSMNPTRQRPILMQMARVYTRFSYIHIDDLSGMSNARADDKAPIDYHDRKWFKEAIQGNGVARETLMSRSVNRPSLTLATAIRRGNKIVGVATVGTELTSVLEDALGTRIGTSGYAIVVDEQGRTLAHPDTNYSFTLKNISDFPPVRFALQGNHGAIAFEDEHKELWLAYAASVGNGWTALTLQKQSEVLAQATLVQRTAVGVAVCAILLVALLISLTAINVLRPINSLTVAARGLANGNWKSRAPEDRSDEVGMLARTFNSMASQLEEGYRHIEEEVARRTAELTRNNEELREARHAAESANRAKDQFLANMSHEIRTPMTAILGFAEVLDSAPTDTERQEAVEIMRRTGTQLLQLINDILDISKIEAGLLVTKSAVDLPAWVSQLVAEIRPRAIKKNLNFKASFDGPAAKSIHTDPVRLRQIITNVVGNAIKFTERGDVELRITCKSIQRNETINSEISFEVRDTGIGMSPQQLSRLFKPFTQVDDSMTRRFGGTGLGLCISKRLATILGGDLTVESEIGRGSTFHLTIDGGPVTFAENIAASSELLSVPSSAEASKPIHLRGRILLAEDGPDNQRLISQFLRKAGAEVVIAENGRIAVSLAESQQFDLILMDMQMPELDGYGATRQLRLAGHKIPIVALTAHAMAEDRAKCLAAGCDDFFTKPISKNSLLTNTAAYLPGGSRRSASNNAA
jgi:signal transduction histidine kinase/CheY-like chemotaxis protein